MQGDGDNFNFTEMLQFLYKLSIGNAYVQIKEEQIQPEKVSTENAQKISES
jgi:hypothetical protein